MSAFRRIFLGAVAGISIGGLAYTSIQAWRTFSEVGPPQTATGSEVAENKSVPISDFSFTERSGKTVGRKDLLGKVWVADFIFTNCPGICPKLSAEMARLQEDLADTPARLVSFTVDPERDTPERLREYAEVLGADRERWLFLTGEKEALHRFIEESFRLAVGGEPGEGSVLAMDITHSGRFVLLDRSGRIRGYFDAADPVAMERLKAKVRSLLRDEPKGA